MLMQAYLRLYLATTLLASLSLAAGRTPRMASPISFSAIETQKCSLLHRPDHDRLGHAGMGNASHANKTLIINLGLPKSGSSSASQALSQILPGPACHNQVLERWPQDLVNFFPRPLDGATPLSRELARCTEVSNTWSLLFPAVYTSLMASFPNAKIYLTRWRDCETWLKHYKGLNEVGIMAHQWVKLDFHRFAQCAFGSMFISNATRSMYIEACKRHEMNVLTAARKYGRPVLFVENEEPDHVKIDKFEQFLGLSLSRLGGRWPHVCSPSTAGCITGNNRLQRTASQLDENDFG
tara:strand:- start:359 stop:1243 length:885 start_codon:yes stop_codon:yes gene_type:complete